MTGTAEIFDDDVGLAIYKTLEAEFGSTLPLQFPGITTDSATEDDSEWLKAQLLSGDDVRVRAPKDRPQTMRRGLFQVSCSSRFAGRAKHKNHNRPWQLSKIVYKLFNNKSLTVLKDGSGTAIGCMSVIKGSTNYVDENEIAKATARGFLDPSNVHSVIVTFTYQVTSN